MRIKSAFGECKLHPNCYLGTLRFVVSDCERAFYRYFKAELDGGDMGILKDMATYDKCLLHSVVRGHVGGSQYRRQVPARWIELGYWHTGQGGRRTEPNDPETWRPRHWLGSAFWIELLGWDFSDRIGLLGLAIETGCR